MALALLFALILSLSLFLGGDQVLGLLYVPEGLEDITRFFYHMLRWDCPPQYIMNVGSVLSEPAAMF